MYLPFININSSVCKNMAKAQSNVSKESLCKLKILCNRKFRILISREHKSSISHALLQTDVNTFEFTVTNYIYKFKTC